jgi:prepilin-type N-terminal cleavage/methylation domain-containing protein
MNSKPPHSHRTKRAFTIIELVAVIVVASILAATVMPAVSRLGTMRESAGAWEIRRQLAYARERAVASGVPVGVRFSQADQTIELRAVSPAGGVTALIDALGRPEAALPFADRFSSNFIADAVTVTLPANEDRTTIWFGHTGTPHARTALGVRAGDTSEDLRITVGDASTIVVASISGLVEGP